MSLETEYLSCVRDIAVYIHLIRFRGCLHSSRFYVECLLLVFRFYLMDTGEVSELLGALRLVTETVSISLKLYIHQREQPFFSYILLLSCLFADKYTCIYIYIYIST